MGASAFILRLILNQRCRKGKEDPDRLGERMGVSGLKRPPGSLVWFHAASVGEAQSTLILIDAVRKQNKDLNILVTTGTVTSADLMRKRLPAGAMHQYYPFDHPQWVGRFLDHWQPDLAVWMESELWPNMLLALKDRGISAALVNARLSPKSFSRWRLAAEDAKTLLETFTVCLAQTQDDARFFRQLGARAVTVSDNLKYSAAPLPCDDGDLALLRSAIQNRPLWLYASTHAGEEDMACRLHSHLSKTIPGLLTIIAPRHPERRDDIVKICEKYGIRPVLRGENKAVPCPQDGLYIADTLGELGLFYRLAPLACIGRSFSNDGGGGHNPIEAAQLGCAVLHGPNVQNLSRIYEDMNTSGASIGLKNEADFQSSLERILKDKNELEALRNKSSGFAQGRAEVLKTVMGALAPLLERLSTEQGKKSAWA